MNRFRVVAFCICLVVIGCAVFAKQSHIFESIEGVPFSEHTAQNAQATNETHESTSTPHRSTGGTFHRAWENTWAITEPSVLHTLLKNLIADWQNDKYSVMLETGWGEDLLAYQATFYNEHEWRIQSESTPNVVIERKNGHDVHVEIEADSYNMNATEFDMLVPLHHLQMVEQEMEEQTYHFITWKMNESEQVEAEIHFSGEILNDAFSAYLSDHFDTVVQADFRDYAVTYVLRMDVIANGELIQPRLSELTFQLHDDYRLLETLNFSW